MFHLAIYRREAKAHTTTRISHQSKKNSFYWFAIQVSDGLGAQLNFGTEVPVVLVLVRSTEAEPRPTSHYKSTRPCFAALL